VRLTREEKPLRSIERSILSSSSTTNKNGLHESCVVRMRGNQRVAVRIIGFCLSAMQHDSVCALA
jgi:hypothetical protein